MAGAGYGSKDADGSWGFRATADGKVILGNTADDVIQVTGTVEQLGTSFKISGNDPRIKIDGVTDSHPGLEFHENGTRKWIIFNNYGDDSLDFKSGPAASSTTRMVIDADGKVGIGTDSPDYTLDVAGDIGVDQYIYHNGDGNTWINFTDNRIRLNAGGNNFIDCEDPGSAPHKVRINNGGNNIDFVIKDKNNNVYFTADASTSRVGIGTTTPSVDLEVDGTIKGEYYITTPSTQDLGSGTSSTLSIGSSLMFLDADSITGAFHAQMGMDVHTLNLPNGTTSGQRLTLVIEGNMGAADNMPIMLAGNLLGAIDMFIPTAKTSLNFVYYSTSTISAWYQL